MIKQLAEVLKALEEAEIYLQSVRTGPEMMSIIKVDLARVKVTQAIETLFDLVY